MKWKATSSIDKEQRARTPPAPPGRPPATSTTLQAQQATPTRVAQVFLDVDATLMEMNPFTLEPASGQPFPLDVRLELDDTARFRSGLK